MRKHREAFVLFLAFFIPWFISSCVSKAHHEDHHPLSEQVLSPRAGYKTLTNQVINCDEKGACTVDVIQYDLNDINVRHTLKELGFRCDVNGHMYFICENGPGLCRREYDILHKFLGIVVKREAVFAPAIDINDRYQFLLDSKTRCKAHKRL